jgi:hypothetical protein
MIAVALLNKCLSFTSIDPNFLSIPFWQFLNSFINLLVFDAAKNIFLGVRDQLENRPGHILQLG